MKNKLLNILNNSNLSILDKKEILEYIERLEDDSLFLEALEQNGVDNWEWYDESFKDYQKWKEKELNVTEL